MTGYKHGCWYCKPADEEEAKEIIERAIASGARVEDVVSDSGTAGDEYRWDLYRTWGVKKGSTWTIDVEACFSEGTEYTIAELRQKFPLPGEQENKEWRGPEDGMPPVGVECEMLFDGEWISAKLIGFDEESPIVKMQIKRDLCTEIVYRACYNCKYRPLRTEREKWVEAASKIACKDFSIEHAIFAAGEIYDAMQSGQLKAPTNEPG